MKGEFSFPVGRYFMIGKEVPRWLQRLDFHSCTDEALLKEDENMLSQMGHNRLMSE